MALWNRIRALRQTQGGGRLSRKSRRSSQQPLRIELLEDRRLLTTTFNPFTGLLTVTGTPGNDTIALQRNPVNPNNTLVVVNGTPEFNRPSFLIRNANISGLAGNDTITIGNAGLHAPLFPLYNVSVAGGPGNDTINIFDTTAGHLVTVNPGAGNDTVDVGNGNLNNLQGAVRVNGQETGNDFVNVNDQSNAIAPTYTITSTTVSRFPGFFGGLTYSGIKGLRLNGSSGADTYNVVSTAAGTPVTLNGGNGNDTFNVSPTAQNLDSIQGALSLFGGGGTDSVTLNDQAKAGDTTYSLTSTTVNRTGAAQISYTGDEGLTLNGSSGADTYNVVSTAAGTPVTLNGGNGNDTFNVSPTAQNLDSIQGALSLFGGGGTDSVILNDQAKAGDTTYSLTSTTVNRTGAAQISYTDDEGLMLNGSSGADTYNVVSTAAGTPVTLNGGNGNDTFNVSPTAQNLDSIQGALSLFGGGGTDSVILNDQAKAGDTTYSLTSTTVNRTGAVQISHTGDEGLTLNGGSGVNTYNVQQAGILARINAGTGDDTIKFSNGAGVTGLVDGQAGIDTLDYSLYTTPISIDLVGRTATGIGGFANIERIIA